MLPEWSEEPTRPDSPLLHFPELSAVIRSADRLTHRRGRGAAWVEGGVIIAAVVMTTDAQIVIHALRRRTWTVKIAEMGLKDGHTTLGLYL